MKALTKKQMIDGLSRALKAASSGELAAIHDDLFLGERANGQVDGPTLLAKIQARIAQGLTPESAVDLWNVVVVDPRCVGYNEEEDRFEVQDLSSIPLEID